MARHLKYFLPSVKFSFFRRISTSSINYKDDLDPTNEIIEHDREFSKFAERCFSLGRDHTCFIINPYIKWGPKKEELTKPENRLAEAESLVRTLSSWNLRGSLNVPLESFEKSELFGSGTATKLKQRIRSDKSITAVFINLSMLKNVQFEELEKLFQVPIFDRYQIVLQILRVHAISKHAKLQVALAEVMYLKANLKQYLTHFMAASDFDTKRVMLQNREQKIKSEIKKLRIQRELLRKKRKELAYPVIAVVGYTNAGKTSLIKALTGDKNLQPRNQLFATLDVTAHAGFLKSNLEVLYIDTVGFISNIPTNLIECFIATLEDALYADVILHVQDLASEEREFQCKHVLSTLENLTENSSGESVSNKLLSVGNKCDLVQKPPNDLLLVSSTKGTGLDELKEELEKLVVESTGRKVITLRVPIGGDEIRWLYKNSTIVSTEEEDNFESQKVNIIITHANLQKFKHLYISRK